MGELPVASVETGDVMKALDPIWLQKPETAARTRGRVEAVLDYAAARGWRSGDNPARWKGHLANLLPARDKVQRVQHHAALPWREIGAFMAELAQREGMAALALQFPILTAARSGEVRGARWNEIDLDAKVWTAPGERMKAECEHRVPLSDRALEILHAVAPLRKAADGLVFPGGRMEPSVVRHGLGDGSAAAARGADGAWLPLVLPRLVRRGDELPARGGRGGAGTCPGRQDRGGLSAGGHAGTAGAADGDVERFLRSALGRGGRGGVARLRPAGR
ncbi:MAG: tyrosine-type recombinase/integrase, partial [Acetobacteraceae bacterium]